MTPEECHQQIIDILSNTSTGLGAHFLLMIKDSLEAA